MEDYPGSLAEFRKSVCDGLEFWVVVQFIELRSLCSLVRHKLKLPW